MILSEIVDAYNEMARCLSRGRFPHLPNGSFVTRRNAINRLFIEDTLVIGVKESRVAYFFDQTWAEIFKEKIFKDSFGLFRLERVDSVGLGRYFNGECLECFELQEAATGKKIHRFAIIRGYDRPVEISNEMINSIPESSEATLVH